MWFRTILWLAAVASFATALPPTLVVSRHCHLLFSFCIATKNRVTVFRFIKWVQYHLICVSANVGACQSNVANIVIQSILYMLTLTYVTVFMSNFFLSP